MSIVKTNTGISFNSQSVLTQPSAPKVFFVATNPITTLQQGAWRHVTFDNVTQSQTYSGWSSNEFTVPVKGVYNFHIRLLGTVPAASFGTLGYSVVARLNVAGVSDDIRLFQNWVSDQSVLSGQVTLPLDQNQHVRLEMLSYTANVTLLGGYHSEFTGFLAQVADDTIPPLPSDYGNVYFVARNPSNITQNSWQKIIFANADQTTPATWLNNEFSAPKLGLYLFTVNFLSTVVNTTGFGTLGYSVYLRLNSPAVSNDIRVHQNWESGQVNIGGQAAIILAQNQKVHLEMLATNTDVNNLGDYYSQFTGILVQEL